MRTLTLPCPFCPPASARIAAIRAACSSCLDSSLGFGELSQTIFIAFFWFTLLVAKFGKLDIHPWDSKSCEEMDSRLTNNYSKALADLKREFEIAKGPNSS